MDAAEKDYEDLLKSFNKHKVKYCIVGAYALALYATPRYTKDMDLFVEATPANAKKILAALRDFGFAKLSLKESDFSKPGKTVQLGYEPVRADILTSIDGCTFEEVWRNRKKEAYGSVETSFIGVKELIKNKRISGRKQDKVDIQTLNKRKRSH